jgi:putative ABC transport system permease protein
LIFLGSSIGFLIAIGIIEVLHFIPIKQFVGTPVLSIDVVLATVSVLSLIGLAAGLMPARKAANLDVVECLRM